MAVPTLSLTDRLTAEAVHALAGLPQPVQRLQAGSPVRIDGLELHPEVQLLLKVLRLWPEASKDSLAPPEARARRLRQARMFEGPKVPVARVDELVIGGSNGPI